MTAIEGFLAVITNIHLIFLAAAGVFVGIYVGAIPGLSGTMAISLLISFTYGWEVMPAMAAMIGIFTGAVYGGSRSAILLNIPGAPSAIATSFDGYPLARLGEGGIAMGLSVTQSVIGEFFSIVVLIIAAPIVTKLAIHFTAQDYFLLGVMGLLLVGSLSLGSFVKAIVTAFLGIIIGMVGLDPYTGQARLTFGSYTMQSGISFIVVMIGMFGLSEALLQLKQNIQPVKQQVNKIAPGLKQIKENLPLTIRCSIIGTLIGALPGTGGDIAALIAYDHAKRTIKKPSRPFGEGAYEGVIAPETANNAAIGGAFIPMLTLGIPGDSGTAILIGALLIHGIRPGPMLMGQQPEFFGMIVGCLIMSNVFLYIFGFTGIKVFSKIVEIPKAIIIPIIVTLSIIGSYCISNNISDIYFMIAFGIFGYILRIYNFPLSPMILGVILSPIIELNLRRGIDLTSGHNIFEFFTTMFTQSISLILLLVIASLLFTNTKLWDILKIKLDKNRSYKKS